MFVSNIDVFVYDELYRNRVKCCDFYWMKTIRKRVNYPKCHDFFDWLHQNSNDCGTLSLCSLFVVDVYQRES